MFSDRCNQKAGRSRKIGIHHCHFTLVDHSNIVSSTFLGTAVCRMVAKLNGWSQTAIFDWVDVLDYLLERYADQTMQITTMVASLRCTRRMGDGEDRKPRATFQPCHGSLSQLAVHQISANFTGASIGMASSTACWKAMLS